MRESQSPDQKIESVINPRVENPSRFLPDKTNPCEEIKGVQGYGGKAGNKIDVNLGVLNHRACFVEPIYPMEAVSKRIAGRILVEVRVDGNGKVISAKAIEGDELLRQSAVDATYRTEFVPIWLRGEPVNVKGVLIYNFVLTE